VIGSSLRPLAKAWCGAWVVLTAVALSAGCSGDKEGQAKAQTRAPAVPVSTALVEVKSMPLEVQTFGTVQCMASVSVKALVTEVLTEVHFKKGQAIAKDDLLFTIDKRPFDVAVRRAQADLDRDQVQAKTLHLTADREKDLFSKGASTPFQRDIAISAAEAADATVRADQADLDKAKLDVEHCTIRSPIAGVAGDILVMPGNVVKANDMPLVVINQISPVQVFFSVPEAQLETVKNYLANGRLKVEVSLPDSDAIEDGKLTFIDNQVDDTTGTVKLGATFANEKQRLWPGQFARVSLRLSVQKDALVIPAKALQTGRDGKYVFVVVDNKAQLRPVTVERTVGRDAVIIGLNKGEVIVTDGQMNLDDQTPVRLGGRGDGAATATKPAGKRNEPTSMPQKSVELER